MKCPADSLEFFWGDIGAQKLSGCLSGRLGSQTWLAGGFRLFLA